MAPPSGEDSLQVRQTYLRRRHADRSGTHRRIAAWIIGGAVAGILCVAGLGVLILGS